MKKAFSVLKERRGVTLIESLCSIVIFVLLTAMIATMVTTASRAMGAAAEIDRRADAALSAIAEYPNVGDGAADVTLDFGGGATIDLKLASATAEGVTLYKLQLPPVEVSP